MCGIVGYLGPRDAYPIIIKGLKRLEYRGYDSAGIATLKNGKFELVIIHNGIIENYQSLRKELLTRGYSFKSDTDTEVLINLIEDVQKKEGVKLGKAVQIALNQKLTLIWQDLSNHRRFLRTLVFQNYLAVHYHETDHPASEKIFRLGPMTLR